MKKRICGLLTALALCLALLPGTALAADGVVTISDSNGMKSVVLEPGKFYVPDNSWGVKEQADLPESGEYLTYADGVLTVSEGGIFIHGSMSLRGDLKIRGGVLFLTARTGTALSLTGHTLTVDGYLDVSNDLDDVAVSGGGGTIRSSSNSTSVLKIRSSNGLAAQDLTIENAAGVRIDGYTASGGVVQKLTVKNSEVLISQFNSGNSTIVEANQITTEDGGKFWAVGGSAPTNDPYFLNRVSVPTVWTAGTGGEMYYEPPAAAGGAATLTLKNAAYQKQLDVHNNPVQVVLEGTNELANFSADKVTLTGDGSFTGKISTLEGGFTNHATGEVNVVVENPPRTYTVYGKRSTSDIRESGVACGGQTPLTVTSGATLTVEEGEELTIFDSQGLKNQGTVVNDGTILFAPDSSGTASFGKILNNGVFNIILGENDSTEGLPALIKSLGLTGDGHVEVFLGGNKGPSYTNGGKPLLEAAGALTLDGTAKNEPSKGYKWEPTTDTDGNITGGKLTLAEGFNATSVTLPQADVEIVTQGESTIGELGVAAGTSVTRDLIFSGPGPLKIQQHVEIGGNKSSLTVAAGARVEVTGGVTVSDSGVVDGTVTVNGTLVSRNNGGAALVTGKVSVGPSGKLEVYGATGMQLGGMSTDSGGKDFAEAFTVQPGGRFEGDCTASIVFVQESAATPFEESLRAEDIISIPSGYLPQGLAPEFSGDRKSLSIPGNGPFNISSDNLPLPPTPGPAPDPDPKPEPEPTPDPEPSESGGSSGGSSYRGGGGSNRPTASITVESSDHGEVLSDRSSAAYGAPVTLTVLPDRGYELEELTVTDRQGYRMKLSELGGGKYAFTMPGGPVTVRGTFAAVEEGNCPSRAFSDLDASAWYHEATDLVLERGLMNGYGDGTFRPDGVLTRAQVAQILYNQAGRPAAAGGGFADVAPGAWCAPAIAWAAERGIVSGYAGGTFRPNGQITREQLAVMLWRYAGSPAPSGGSLSFPDAGQAGDFAREALAWAAESGVMSGYADGRLAPKGPVTRAQAAQLLKNFASHG